MVLTARCPLFLRKADQRQPFTAIAQPIGAGRAMTVLATLTSIAMETHSLATLVQDPSSVDFRRCGSALAHINSLAEDGEWLCHLPEGHDDVCRAPDGTTW